jgi:2-phosphosulfolactate phosphatase
MSRSLEVIFAPAEYAGLPDQDLSRTTCVVFDVLRATSTMITALAEGATAIIPVAEIADAVRERKNNPDVLLAGERDGWKIRAAQSGGIDFDFGNSPREFTREKVNGKTIVITTTNGTRALVSCRHALRVFAGSLLNLGAVAGLLQQSRPERLLLIGAGTFEETSLEDAIGVGALCHALWPLYETNASDAAWIARDLFARHGSDLRHAIGQARNGRRLLERPELRDDVAWCADISRYNLNAEMSGGRVLRI